MILLNKKRIILFVLAILLSIIIYLLFFNNSEVNKVASLYVSNVDLDKKTVIIDPGHGLPDERNSLLTLKNNIDLLQKIKCFKHFIFFMLKRRLIYAKQRIW